MSQHDMNIANQGFPNTRSDLNLALVALVSNSSGATAPSTMYAYQWWLDTNTTPTTLKMRNTANDAWITVMFLNQSTNIMSMGVVSFSEITVNGSTTVAAGTALLPSIISTTGTADTGMWFPAADTIAYSTAGTERMRISSAGVVSITGSATISTTLAVTGVTTVAAGSAAAPSIVSTTGTSDTGEFFPSADTIAWSTAGVERMRIGSGGLVGIGVTAGAALHVFGNNGNFGFNSFFGLNSSTAGIGIGNNATIGLIQGAASATSATTADIAMQSSGGNLTVGTTNTSNTSGTGIKLIPTEGSVSGRATLSIVTVESTSATTGFRLYSTGAAAYRFYIDNDGKPYSTLPLGTISDARLKTNIKNISYGLEDLLKIRPVNFDWKDGSDTNRVGFIAQELKLIISQAVTDTKNIAEDETPYMAVTESNLIPVMVKAIQEQQAIIETLKSRITSLENK